MTCYTESVKIAGNVIQIRHYEKMQVRDFSVKSERRKRVEESSGVDMKSEVTSKTNPFAQSSHADNLKKSAQRAKVQVLDGINANFGIHPKGFLPNGKSVKMITLTYKENMQDREHVARDFNKFIKRLEYHLNEKVIYLAVPELQERGAFHIHLVLLCSFIRLPVLLKLWNIARGEGNFKVEKIRHVHNIGQYVAKYVSADFYQDTHGKKRFWTSQHFFKQVVKFYLNKVSDLSWLDALKRFVCWERHSEYIGEYTGKVKFTEYTLKAGESVKVMLEKLVSSLLAKQPDSKSNQYFSRLAKYHTMMRFMAWRDAGWCLS